MEQLAPEEGAELEEEAESRRARDGWFRRIRQVSGRVIEAKNLVRTDTWTKSDPYCVVKGIRTNNHLVQLHTTACIQNNLHPQWMEDFSFDCPSTWGLNMLIGLKFLVYDSDNTVPNDTGDDNFLGGADLDLSDAPSNRTMQHTLEMGGVELKIAPSKAAVLKRRKPLLVVKVCIVHEECPKPPPQEELLLRSLTTLNCTTKVECRVIRARNLRHADLMSKSDPQCIVRILTIAGKAEEVYRTEVINNTLDPQWNGRFVKKFNPDNAADEPVLLVFDIYDDDDGGQTDVTETGDHLGSAMVALAEFPTGVLRKKKLHLQGESQLLETLLSREGKPGGDSEKQAKLKAANSSMDSPMPLGSKVSRIGRLLKLFNHLKHLQTRKAKGDTNTLTLEVIVHRSEEPMPFAALLREVVDVREEEDVAAAISLPDWQRSFFKMPMQLKRDAEGEGRPKLASFRSKDRIVFIHGVLRGATALISADSDGKSDPYCIVEGATISDQKYFIHRTQVVYNKLCPLWQEAFFFAVPEKVTINRLNFSIYDCDQNFLDGGLLDGNDDFLGRISLDLSYLRNGDRIAEDLPLTGSKGVRPQASKANKTTVFRRNSTLSVEVWVERRACPVYEVRRDQGNWKPPLRHVVSHTPPINRRYVDPSQGIVTLQAYESTAAQAIVLYESNQLVQRKDELRDQQWMRNLDKGRWRALTNLYARALDTSKDNGAARPEATFEQEEAALLGTFPALEEADNPDALHDCSNLRRSGAPAERRVASLPALHTRLGRSSGPAAHYFANLRPDWVDTLRFSANGQGRDAAAILHAVGTKPSLEMVTQVGL